MIISDKNEPGNWYKDGVLLVPGETIMIEVNDSNILLMHKLDFIG